jgi:hypothetical protein
MSYIPRGCDQQGRYPEAAEAATDVGLDEPPEQDMFKVVMADLLIAVSVIGVIAIIVLLAMGRG